MLGVGRTGLADHFAQLAVFAFIGAAAVGDVFDTAHLVETIILVTGGTIEIGDVVGGVLRIGNLHEDLIWSCTSRINWVLLFWKS